MSRTVATLSRFVVRLFGLVLLVLTIVSGSAASAVSTWSTPNTISNFGYAYPALVYSGESELTAVWWGQDNGAYPAVYASTGTQTGSWSSPHLLWQSNAYFGLESPPEISADASGNVTAVWSATYTSANNGFVYVATKLAGQPWGAAEQVVARNGQRIYDVQVVRDNSGGVHFAFFENNNILTTYSKLAGSSSWVDQSTGGLGPISSPSLALNAAGDVTMYWNEFVNSSNWLLKSRTISTAAVLGPITDLPVTGASKPEFFIDSNGNEHAIWLRSNLVEATYKPVGGSWQTPQQVSSSTSNYPKITADSAGTATALWVESSSVKTSRSSAGSPWDTPTTLGTTTDSQAQISSDTAGNVTAVWGDFKLAKAATRLAGSAWQAAVALNTDNGLYPNFSRVVSGPQGATTALWVRGTAVQIVSITNPTPLTPIFDTPVRSVGGYTVNITNYDATYTWTPSVSVGNVAAGTPSGSILPLTVTGLADGQSSTLTVGTAKSGSTDGTGQVAGSALAAGLVPTFDTPVRTADGFTVNVTNYDAAWTWTPSTSAGNVAAGTPVGSNLPLTVTGVGPGLPADVTVETTRSGYLAGTQTIIDQSLEAARTPTFSQPVRTADGFTVRVTNYDAAWTWSRSVSHGSISAGNLIDSTTIEYTVTGLTPGSSSTVTVTSNRTGYATGSSTETSSALQAARVPTFDSPVRTANGFTVNVTNYDVAFTWTPSASGASVSVGTASGGSLPLTVSGLAPGTSSLLAVTTTRSGYASGNADTSAAALNVALQPTFDTPVRTVNGFTVNVTNYDPSWTWTQSVSAGSITAGSNTGSTLPLTVTGLSAGASSTITVGATRAGFSDGSATVSSGALASARTPVFGTPVPTADGFTVDITNYDSSWSWIPSVTVGSVFAGTATGSTLPLTVTGVNPATSSTLTVATNRNAYLSGTANTSETSLLAALTVAFDTPVSTGDGFTVNVTNYDAAWTWTKSVSSGTVTAGTITGSTLPLTVTGLPAGGSATLTVEAQRTGYATSVETKTHSAIPVSNPVVSITFQATIGQQVAGSNTSVVASGLQPTAPYSVVVRSTPTTIGSGSAVNGRLNQTFAMPSGLDAGWHTVTFSSTGSSGEAVTKIVYLKVSSTGALLSTSETMPADYATAGLVSTGLSVAPYLGAGSLLLLVGAGLVVLFSRRRPVQ